MRHLIRFIVLACALTAAPGLLHAASVPPPSEDCTWGEPGYRACVDGLIARSKAERGSGVLDPQRALDEAARKARPAGQAASGKASKRRRGAGSLTPVPPAELRITPPDYDPRADAITAERRQRQVDDNLFRLQRSAPPEPILPPVINPPNGRICPSWGC